MTLTLILAYTRSARSTAEVREAGVGCLLWLYWLGSGLRGMGGNRGHCSDVDNDVLESLAVSEREPEVLTFPFPFLFVFGTVPMHLVPDEEDEDEVRA